MSSKIVYNSDIESEQQVNNNPQPVDKPVDNSRAKKSQLFISAILFI